MDAVEEIELEEETAVIADEEEAEVAVVAEEQPQDVPLLGHPHLHAPFDMQPNDVRMDAAVRRQRRFHCPVEPMDAEDNLFILYTSGRTGQPNGLVQTTGGYALYAAFITQTTFVLDNNNNNNNTAPPTTIFCCVIQDYIYHDKNSSMAYCVSQRVT